MAAPLTPHKRRRVYRSECQVLVGNPVSEGPDRVRRFASRYWFDANHRHEGLVSGPQSTDSPAGGASGINIAGAAGAAIATRHP